MVNPGTQGRSRRAGPGAAQGPERLRIAVAQLCVCRARGDFGPVRLEIGEALRNADWKYGLALRNSHCSEIASEPCRARLAPQRCAT